MGWAPNPNDVAPAIAASIFSYIGTPALFITNLYFAERIVRGQHPTFGWSTACSLVIPVSLGTLIITFVCLMASVIVAFDTNTDAQQHSARALEQYGLTIYAIAASLPVFITGASTCARAHPYIKRTKTMDKFGEGSMRAKIAIVLLSGSILSLSGWYCAGVSYSTPLRQDSSDRPGYLSQAAFYVFTWMLEFLVVAGWIVARVDRRFFVPDRAKGPFSYAGGFVFAGEPGHEKSARHRSEGEESGGEPATGGTNTTDSSGYNSGSSTAKHSSLAGSITPSTRARSRSRGRRSGIHHSAHTAHTSTHSPRRSRASLASRLSRASSRSLNGEERISWGGIPRSAVMPAYDEHGEEMPYGAWTTTMTAHANESRTGIALPLGGDGADVEGVGIADGGEGSEDAQPQPPIQFHAQHQYTHHVQQQASRQNLVQHDYNHPDYYDPYDPQFPSTTGVDVENAEELGFNARTGKWTLRPISASAVAARQRESRVLEQLQNQIQQRQSWHRQSLHRQSLPQSSYEGQPGEAV